MTMRISVPSYVIPGSYAENLRFLSDKTGVDGVELLFFMYDTSIHDLMLAELDEIRDFGSRFRYTLHMPDTISAGHREIIELTRELVSGYIIHPPRDDADLPVFARLMDEWRNAFGSTAFHLENTRLDRFMAADAALAASRFGRPPLCADIGHLRMEGIDPLTWLGGRQETIAEFHLHGFDGSHDHMPFSVEEAWFKAMQPRLQHFDGVIELELFDWSQLDPIVTALRQALEIRQ
jgi:sugar phosphate isomerase/epimerase